MAEDILITVARAESLRRRRLLTRQLLRVVPVVAGGLLVTAALFRVVHAPLVMFWVMLVAAVVGVALFAFVKSRVPVVTDAAATQLDRDAALGGELRSAHWFASHPANDPWVTHHLAGAESRVETVSWPSVYPPVKTARVWTGSAVLTVAAVALAMSATWMSARPSAGTAADAPAAPVGIEADGQLSAELQKQIDDLITAVQKGAVPLDVAREKLAELRDKLAGLDPNMQEALAKAAQGGMQPSETDPADPKAAELAARAEKAAAKSDLPQDMKWSMQDLAAKLAKASQAKSEAGEKGESGGEKSSGKEQAGGEQQKPQDGAAQMTRSTSAETQSSQMMATTASPMAGEASGDAKDDPKKGKLGAPLDLSALRKETIEADSDTEGANVLAEMRRKSEQSRSTLSFSRVAPLAAYDKSHATAPPPPPDALRALVRQYFIRK